MDTEEMITISEASKILDVTISTVSYYIRSGKLEGVESEGRTAHRKKRKLLRKTDVLSLKEKMDSK